MKKPTPSLFTFDHVRIAPSRQIAAHEQPTWELSYVIVGSGTKTIGQTSEPFGPGEVILICPEQTHGWVFSEDDVDPDGCIENITVCFDGEMLDQLTLLFPQTAHAIARLKDIGTSVVLGQDTAQKVIAKLHEMEAQSGALRQLTLYQIIILMGEGTDGRHFGIATPKDDDVARLEKVDVFIHRKFMRAIALDDVARHVGMSRSSLCTFYKRLTGRTLFADINALRVGYAQYLLRSTSRPVSVIAYQSGFGDVPYFNRVFKREVGVSPMEWRAGACSAP